MVFFSVSFSFSRRRRKREGFVHRPERAGAEKFVQRVRVSRVVVGVGGRHVARVVVGLLADNKRDNDDNNKSRRKKKKKKKGLSRRRFGSGSAL